MSGTQESHHPADLALFHKNPRVGDVDAITGSLRANGQYKPLVVNRGTHTGRSMEVIAGNHTLKAIRGLAETYPDDDRWQSVDCWVIDVDDDRAARIVAADNRTSELGGFDVDLLTDLLEDMTDLEGTGYTDDDLVELMAASSRNLDDLSDFLGNTSGGGEPTTSTFESDDDDGSDDGDSSSSSDEPEPELYLALTFSVTVEQRRRIRAVLNEVKAREGIDSQTEALVWALHHIEGYDAEQIGADSDATINAPVDEGTE